MNIRIELLNLQLKAPHLNAAEFAAKFTLIAEEYSRLQKCEQANVSRRAKSSKKMKWLVIGLIALNIILAAALLNWSGVFGWLTGLIWYLKYSSERQEHGG